MEQNQISVTESHSSELIEPIEHLVVSNVRCDCNTKCKTKRCPCINDNKKNATIYVISIIQFAKIN